MPLRIRRDTRRGLFRISSRGKDATMGQTVFITGTGRKEALGFNLVLRYLEQGDTVIATVRKPSEALKRRLSLRRNVQTGWKPLPSAQTNTN